MPTDNVHALGAATGYEQISCPRENIDAMRHAERSDFLGFPVDCITLKETLALATAAMRSRRRLQHGDLNVAKFIDSRRDGNLRRSINESDVICADGMGIVWGCKLLALPVRERVTGIDLMMGVLELCAYQGYRPYFLGAKQPVLEGVIGEVRRRYPQIEIAGARNGYFGSHEEECVVRDIRASGADCLFVGIASPIKEIFLNRHRDRLGVPLQLGVGGSFDVLAGCIPRAPIWMQRSGLEWLFRLWREPLRLGPRYLRTNTQYVIILAFALARNVLAKRVGFGRGNASPARNRN